MSRLRRILVPELAFDDRTLTRAYAFIRADQVESITPMRSMEIDGKYYSVVKVRTLSGGDLTVVGSTSEVAEALKIDEQG